MEQNYGKKYKKKLENKMQLLVNQQTRAIMGVYFIILIQLLLSKARLMLAQILLSH